MQLYACSTVTRMVNGVKKPKTETPESITKWLEKKNINNDIVASVQPESFFDYFFMLMGSPIVYYKSDCGFISTEYCNGRYCYRSLPAFLENITPAETGTNTWQNYIDEDSIQLKEKEEAVSYIIDSLNNHLCDLNGNKINSLQTIDADYLVIIPFAKYMGATIQTSNMRKALAAIRKNTKSRITVLLLNLDKQQWWGKNWNEKIKISI
jgi:hypothetical protein